MAGWQWHLGNEVCRRRRRRGAGSKITQAKDPPMSICLACFGTPAPHIALGTQKALCKWEGKQEGGGKAGRHRRLSLTQRERLPMPDACGRQAAKSRQGLTGYLSPWRATPGLSGAALSCGQLLPSRNVGLVLPDLLTFQEKQTLLTFELNPLLFQCCQRNQILLGHLAGQEHSSSETTWGHVTRMASLAPAVKLGHF